MARIQILWIGTFFDLLLLVLLLCTTRTSNAVPDKAFKKLVWYLSCQAKSMPLQRLMMVTGSNGQCSTMVPMDQPRSGLTGASPPPVPFETQDSRFIRLPPVLPNTPYRKQHVKNSVGMTFLLSSGSRKKNKRKNKRTGSFGKGVVNLLGLLLYCFRGDRSSCWLTISIIHQSVCRNNSNTRQQYYCNCEKA